MRPSAKPNEFCDYDVEANCHNRQIRREDYSHARRYRPESIIHHSGILSFPSPESTANSTFYADERRSPVRSKSGPSKVLKKQLARFFRASNNNKVENGPEQNALLQENRTIGGTFDTEASNNNNNGDFVVDGSIHPRSPSRLANKWSHIKEQMNPDQWMRSLESAQALGWGTGLAGSGEYLMSREELIESAQDKIRTLGQINVWHCLVAVLIYIGISVGCFSFWLEEKWTIIDSIYFAFVTFSEFFRSFVRTLV